MVDGPGAADPGLVGLVVRVEGPATIAPRLEGGFPPALEAERALEEPTARLRFGCIGAHALKALERELGRDLGMLGHEGLVLGLDDGELEPEALGVGEGQSPLFPRGGDSLGPEALLPEVERVRRSDAPDDPVHHARPGATSPCAW